MEEHPRALLVRTGVARVGKFAKCGFDHRDLPAGEPAEVVRSVFEGDLAVECQINGTAGNRAGDRGRSPGLDRAHRRGDAAEERSPACSAWTRTVP